MWVEGVGAKAHQELGDQDLIQSLIQVQSGTQFLELLGGLAARKFLLCLTARALKAPPAQPFLRPRGFPSCDFWEHHSLSDKQ